MTGPPKIQRYHLRDRIGSGGVGEVWAGLMEGPAGFRKHVAVKLVEAGQGDEEVLRREARLGAQMRHGNLVDVYQLGRADDGRWFLAMELVPGPTLRELLRATGALPGTALREIGVQICRGLAYAHHLNVDATTTGLVHRDIKASNVLLDPSGMVKLSDFGIARLQGGDTSDVQGTPGYIAPEQLDGATPDARADVYSMGVLLWAMAIGRAPIRPDKAKGRAAVRAAARGAQALARKAQATLSVALPGLDEVVLRCLDPDPSLRYADGRALGKALRALPEPPGPGLVEVMARYEASLKSRHPVHGDEDEQHATHTFRTTGGLRPEDRPLLGRTREVQAIEEHLEVAGAWVTLKGIAGIGKSRLAHHCAHRWASSARPVAWAELDGCTDRIGVLSAIGDALKLTESHDSHSIARALASRTEGLLVLDGVDGLVDVVAKLLPVWRAEAPWLRLLLTGREVVRADDEVVMEIGTLAPDPARELFLASLPDGADQPSEAELASLLDGLEGLPLSLELAASQRSREGVTGGLQSILQASWSELPPWSRRALTQLSVFQGAFLVEAAEAIVDVSAWPDAPWPLALVDELWSRSLLHVRRNKQAQRLSMYRSVRHFVREQEGAAAIVRDAELRHGAWFARFGDEAWLEGLQLAGGEARVRQLARDLDDIVAACRRAVARGDAAVAEHTCLAAWEIVWRRGPLPLAGELLTATLGVPGVRRRSALLCALAQVEDAAERFDEAADAAETPRQRASVLAAKARHLHANNQLEACLTVANEALELSTAAGDLVVQGRALVSVGVAERKLGRPDASEQHLTEGLDRLERVGCIVERSYGWLSLGNLYNLRNRIDEAEEAFHKARRGFRATGMKGAMATSLANLTLVDRARGRFDEAERRIHEALALHRAVGDRKAEISDLAQLASCLTAQGRLTEAVDALNETRLRARDAGMVSDEALGECNLGHCLLLLGREDQALPHFERSQALAESAGIVWIHALAIGNQGIVASQQGHVDRAVECLEEAIRLSRQVRSPRMHGAFLHERERAKLPRGTTSLAVLDQAEVLLDKANDPVEAAKVRCTRARLLARQGDREAARAQLEGLDGTDRRLARRVGEARAELDRSEP